MSDKTERIIQLQLTEGECEEIAVLFDAAVKSMGLKGVPAVNKYMAKMQEAVGQSNQLQTPGTPPTIRPNLQH